MRVPPSLYSVIARSQRVPPSAGPMINSATKRSSFFVALNCFAEPVIGRRGACHRARIRATRWRRPVGFIRATAWAPLRPLLHARFRWGELIDRAAKLAGHHDLAVFHHVGTILRR